MVGATAMDNHAGKLTAGWAEDDCLRVQGSGASAACLPGGLASRMDGRSFQATYSGRSIEPIHRSRGVVWGARICGRDAADVRVV